MLINEIPLILQQYEELKPRLQNNYVLFDIYEGNLLQYILEDIHKQMSAESAKSMEPRVAPINFLKKIVDKLSQIYSDEPRRSLLKKTAQDEMLFEFYQKALSINVEMSLSNEIFNLEKYCAIEPYIDDGVPQLRIQRPDKFFVMSMNQDNPTKMTHYIKIMGSEMREDDKGVKSCVDILHVYTDSEFLIIDSSGEILKNEMIALDNPNGINFVGKIPAIYISRSKFDLIPREDTDLLKMTKMIPLLFSDMNEVIFWQSFSIIYGIDLSADNLKMAPNSFWALKSDPTTQTKPEVGSIKPQADITEVSNFIMLEMQTWLDSRNIKNKTSSNQSGTIDASGVSKMMDELDTSEDRKKQVPFFKRGETELWDLIMNYMHPYWVRNGMLEVRQMFTDKQKVIVDFMEQYPVVDIARDIANIKEQLALGLITRAKALMKLNRGMTEDEAKSELKKIDEESTIEVMEDEDTSDKSSNDEESKSSGGGMELGFTK